MTEANNPFDQARKKILAIAEDQAIEEANHQKTKIKFSGISKITINVGDLIGPELKEQLLAIAVACDDTSRQLKALCGAAPGEETQSPPAGGDGADEQGTQPAFPTWEEWASPEYQANNMVGGIDHRAEWLSKRYPNRHAHTPPQMPDRTIGHPHTAKMSAAEQNPNNSNQK